MTLLDIEIKALQTRKAAVIAYGDIAGYLQMIATDEYEFSYIDEYIKSGKAAISLTMPVTKKTYLSETLHPFFDNLLFEGEQLKEAERKYSLSRHSVVDRFKLLMVTGSHNLSEISVQPVIDGTPHDLALKRVEDDFAKQLIPLTSPFQTYCEICLEELDKGSSHEKCRLSLWGTRSSIKLRAYKDEPVNIFKTIVMGQSISGAQRKSLFSLAENTLEKSGLPTHLVKPDGEFPEMPANEHLTMVIAKKLGFNSPPVGIYHAEGIGLLYVVRRFSNSKNSLGIEDFAQLSQELSEYKDKGSLEGVAKIITKYASSPKLELADFFRRVLFCYLTGNGDMHLKNWSLSKDRQNKLVKLSPVYDLLNVRASFPQERVESILTLEGKQNQLDRKTFLSFASKLKLRPIYVEKTLNETKNWVDTIAFYCERSALTEERKNTYLAIVKERYTRLE